MDFSENEIEAYSRYIAEAAREICEQEGIEADGIDIWSIKKDLEDKEEWILHWECSKREDRASRDATVGMKRWMSFHAWRRIESAKERDAKIAALLSENA